MKKNAFRLLVFLLFTSKIFCQDVDSSIFKKIQLEIPQNKAKCLSEINEQKIKYKNKEAYYTFLALEASLHSFYQEFDFALKVADSVITFSRSDKTKAFALTEKGIVLSKTGKSEEGLKTYQEALKKFEKLGDKKGIAQIFKLIGNTSFRLNKMDVAADFYKKSIEVNRNLNNSNAMAHTMNNLSRVYQAMQKIDSAIYYNDKLLEIALKNNNDAELKFMGYLNDADFKSHLKKFDESFSSLEKANEIAIKSGNKAMQGVVFQVRGALHIQFSDFDSAIKDLELANKIFKEQHLDNEYKSTLHLLKDAYVENKDFANAYDVLKELYKSDLSSANEDLAESVEDFKIKYETKEKELLLAEKELEITKKETLNKVWFGFALLLLILLSLLSVIYILTKKKNANQLLALKKEQEVASLKSLMTGEEKERSRIARELHDGLGGILAAARMQLSVLDNSVKSEKTNSIEELLEKASTESRRISHNLLPENLIKLGLNEALKDFIQGINEGKLLSITYQSIGIEERLPENLELSVYRIIQELLNNIIKHSGATEALVQLHKTEKMLTITVEDNGRGFEEIASKGIGLSNIESRLSLLEGKLSIDSAYQKGTSVYIEIKLNHL